MLSTYLAASRLFYSDTYCIQLRPGIRSIYIRICTNFRMPVRPLIFSDTVSWHHESSREFFFSGFRHVEFVPGSTQDHSCASTPLIFRGVCVLILSNEVPTLNHAAPPGPGDIVRVSRGPERQRRAVRAVVRLRRRYCHYQ